MDLNNVMIPYIISLLCVMICGNSKGTLSSCKVNAIDHATCVFV